MNATFNNFLLASFLFFLYFCLAISFIYSPTPKAVVPTQTTQLFMLTESILEPIPFTVPEILVTIPVQEHITHSDHIDILSTQRIEKLEVDEPTEVELVENMTLFPTPLNEITSVLLTKTIPAQVQEVTETLQTNDIPQDVEEIINKLNKRQTLRLFTPLSIKRRDGKVEKNLATTRTEILALYKENPTEVTAILKTHLPELFT